VHRNSGAVAQQAGTDVRWSAVSRTFSLVSKITDFKSSLPAAICDKTCDSRLVMAALCNRSGHYIFALWFLSIFFLFFLAYSQRPQVGCLPYHVYTRCGPSANLECRSERCCTWLAANAGPKKVAKNRHLGTISQLCRAISSQLKHVSTIGKPIKQQYLLYMSPQYGVLRPTSG